jgi:outer membrane protein OmpA-like peptidoglycan-associated protein
MNLFKIWGSLNLVPKIVIIGILVVVAWFGGTKLGLIPEIGVAPTKTLSKIDLPDLPVNDNIGKVSLADLPTSKVARITGTQVRFLVWAWNSQMGLMLANGGIETTQGSLMDKHGVNVKLTRQDDAVQMQNELIKFATELKDNAQPKNGTHFVAIMGDGSAAFLAGLNPQLEKLGPEYIAQIVGSCGYSRGEDKFMGPQAWKDNPQTAKGALVAAVLRDGDWNIVIKWAADNGIPINPDDKVYNPNAINFVAADSYIDAGQKYIAGKPVNLPVVDDKGKKTGKELDVQISGVTTWTPGDVNVAKLKGGLVSIVSTKEYRSQMPNVIIGIKKWMRSNKSSVENMLAAITDGGDQVKVFKEALAKASEISAQVYKEQDAAYWAKYYVGLTERDAQGYQVELGGSSVNNLADNLQLFGLEPGSANTLKATYEVFGNVVVELYPKLVPSYPKADDVIDPSYLIAVKSKSSVTTVADGVKYNANASTKDIISQKSWNITFDNGKSSFTPSAEKTLNSLLQDVLIASGVSIDIEGHTDNVGSSTGNKILSEERANAVRDWLHKKAPKNVPDNRIKTVGYGDSKPVASNSTPDGKTKNRRVVITFKTTN